MQGAKPLAPSLASVPRPRVGQCRPTLWTGTCSLQMVTVCTQPEATRSTMCECCWHGDCRSRAQHSEQARITRQQQPKSMTVKRCSHSRPPVLKQGVGLRPQRWYGYSNWDQRAHGESPMHQARDGAQATAAVCRTLFTRKRIHNNAQTQKPQAEKKKTRRRHKAQTGAIRSGSSRVHGARQRGQPVREQTRARRGHQNP